MLFGVGVVEREEYTLACKVFEQREVVLALLYLFAVYLFDDCSGLDFSHDIKNKGVFET